MGTFLSGSQGNSEAFVLFNISVDYLKINLKFADNIKTDSLVYTDKSKQLYRLS